MRHTNSSALILNSRSLSRSNWLHQPSLSTWSSSFSCAWATAVLSATPAKRLARVVTVESTASSRRTASVWDVIYIQAKRWDSTVGRPEIQKFAGALQGHRARKGVFLTTASFSAEAIDFASRIDSTVVLIDGPTLAKYMIDSSVGVSPWQTYEVKRIDTDYFAEE